MTIIIAELSQLLVQFCGLLVQGDEFVACRNLIVLYLYDNTLTRVPLLDRNVHLSHLYLQNNKIDRIDGLDSLVRLTKLYVLTSCNNIIAFVSCDDFNAVFLVIVFFS